MHNELFAYNSHLGSATTMWKHSIRPSSSGDASHVYGPTYRQLTLAAKCVQYATNDGWDAIDIHLHTPSYERSRVPHWRLHGWQFKLTQMKRTFNAILFFFHRSMPTGSVFSAIPRQNENALMIKLMRWVRCCWSKMVRVRVFSLTMAIHRLLCLKRKYGKVFLWKTFLIFIFKMPTVDRVRWSSECRVNSLIEREKVKCVKLDEFSL